LFYIIQDEIKDVKEDEIEDKSEDRSLEIIGKLF
jgi:hypothetical protein